MGNDKIDFYKKRLNKMLKIIDNLEKEPTRSFFVDGSYEEIENKIYPIDVARKIKTLEKENLDLKEESTRQRLIKIKKIPFFTFTKDETDIEKISKIIDESHYGMKGVKKRIVEYINSRKFLKLENTPILCLVGSPGVGKTSIVKSIAYSLGRKYSQISLAGKKDDLFINGCDFIYTGSTNGQIINSLINTSVMNPVILLDEIDKIPAESDLSSSLLAILDSSQNKNYVDKFIATPIDISNVLFIATANYIDMIPDALKNRLEIINVDPYLNSEKLIIAKQYIIPKILDSFNNQYEKVKISDDAIEYLIDNYSFESGVRNLKTTISSLFDKYMLDVIANNNIKKNEIDLEYTKKFFPPKKNIINKNINDHYGESKSFYWDDQLKISKILTIESNYYDNEQSSIAITGNIDIKFNNKIIDNSYSYFISKVNEFGINAEKIMDKKIILHFPPNNITKDGNNLGPAIVTSIISVFNKNLVPDDIAMTGYLTLTGKILKTNRVIDEILCAIRNDIKRIFVPKQNEIEIKASNIDFNKIKIIYVEDYKEIYNIVFSDGGNKWKN